MPSPSRIACGLIVAIAAAAHADDVLRNYFDDPFFAISSAIADCPVPLGPLITEAQMRVQSHHRAERGTTCWLRGECEQPNAYAYDAGIAEEIRRVVAGEHPAPASSLWVTVQGRVVYIEGCVESADDGARIERRFRDLPNVQQALAIVRVGPRGAVPYRIGR